MQEPLPFDRARTLARTAGWLYLVIIVGAGFAQGVVRGGLVVPGDAAATAAAIEGASWLFRLGLVGDLVAFAADAAVAVLLYVLLRAVSPTVALMAAAFRLVAHPAIGSLNLVHHLGALLILEGSIAPGTFEPAQLDALALLSLEVHHLGYLLAGVFFGVHLALLGFLLVKSERFPGWLGILVALAAVGYLTETFVHLLFPVAAAFGTALVAVTAGVGEVALCLWLVVRGVRAPASS